ncbi:hypothetical protein K445DRAFT_137074 [Daldinia sp. EC12]|nr:hypothetical protein K445DRAFT_137074 [Daldinia sp. EC12]
MVRLIYRMPPGCFLWISLFPLVCLADYRPSFSACLLSWKTTVPEKKKKTFLLLLTVSDSILRQRGQPTPVPHLQLFCFFFFEFITRYILFCTVRKPGPVGFRLCRHLKLSDFGFLNRIYQFERRLKSVRCLCQIPPARVYRLCIFQPPHNGTKGVQKTSQPNKKHFSNPGLIFSIGFGGYHIPLLD